MPKFVPATFFSSLFVVMLTAEDVALFYLLLLSHHVKRSVKGTHKVVSKKYLQSYLDAFVWHYNQRTCTDAERFATLLGGLLQPSR